MSTYDIKKKKKKKKKWKDYIDIWQFCNQIPRNSRTALVQTYIHSAKVLIGHLEYSKLWLKYVSVGNKTYFRIWINTLEISLSKYECVDDFT